MGVLLMMIGIEIIMLIRIIKEHYNYVPQIKQLVSNTSNPIRHLHSQQVNFNISQQDQIRKTPQPIQEK